MNELPQRKKLRLQRYDYSQNGYYFITLCTHKRQRLFEPSVLNDEMQVIPSNNPANQIIEKWLFELEHKFDIIIDKYVVMPDHIHFIMIQRHDTQDVPHGDDISVPDIMQWFETMTTNEYIRMVKSGIVQPFDKHVWQKSYYDHIIRNEEDYFNTTKYIAENPRKINNQ